ncbi:unnamed protein product [Oppiella nova]|uniref:Uncharacterized protein n=1 Tax=Oppiella nova TaxID=334625 RepID=A0A7R9MKL6_9ACAR|nr:unnamed protein product [Oppiella nova]CAG2178986.1 unnamed protein product [Oppiella nova]
MYYVYKTHFTRICSECDSDLLTAIVLFNPNRPNLIHRNVIKLEQNIYIYLLQRYLHYKYDTEYEAKCKCERLLDTLQDITILGDMQMKDTSQENADDFGPLSRENFLKI